MVFEEKLIYFPSKYPSGVWDARDVAPAEGEIAPKIEDCWFVTADGLKLHGWFGTPLRRKDGAVAAVAAEMVLLWFHGNAGNVTDRYDMMRRLVELPVRVFIIDYRGYGRSEGSPSEQGLYLDAQAAWGHLTKTRDIPADRIIIFGKSLGGAPAIDLATRVQPAGLIVQSSFTSISDMVGTILPVIPGLLLRTRMNSVDKIKDVRCPKLFIHSRADEVVPYKLGRRLFEAAPEPKRFYEVEGAPHNETYLVGGAKYFQAIKGFIDSCAAKALIESQRSGEREERNARSEDRHYP